MSTREESGRVEYLEDVTVAQFMHHSVVSCAADTPLSEVASRMHSERIHCMLVEAARGEDPRRWGVVSDLDLVAAAGTRKAPVGSIAETPALTVSTADSVARAVELMKHYRTAHLLVLDLNGDPVGVISTLDVARIMARTD